MEICHITWLWYPALKYSDSKKAVVFMEIRAILC